MLKSAEQLMPRAQTGSTANNSQRSRAKREISWRDESLCEPFLIRARNRCCICYAGNSELGMLRLIFGLLQDNSTGGLADK
jgi:hypothetical protein